MSTYFQNFHHTCGLKIDGNFESYHREVSHFHRFPIKWTSIDPKSETTMQYFKSHAAVVKATKFHIENHPNIIHPLSQFKFLWESLMAVNFLTSLIYCPLQYLDYVNNDRSTNIENILLIKIVKFICVIDMTLRFFCGYVDEKKFEVSAFRREQKRHKNHFCRHENERERGKRNLLGNYKRGLKMGCGVMINS